MGTDLRVKPNDASVGSADSGGVSCSSARVFSPTGGCLGVAWGSSMVGRLQGALSVSLLCLLSPCPWRVTESLRASVGRQSSFSLKFPGDGASQSAQSPQPRDPCHQHELPLSSASILSAVGAEAMRPKQPLNGARVAQKARGPWTQTVQTSHLHRCTCMLCWAGGQQD